MSDLRLWHRHELNKLRQDMQDLFDCLVRDFCNSFDVRMLPEDPVLRVEAEGDKIVITASIPKLDPATLKLSAQGNRLFLFGEKVDADEQGNSTARHSFSSTVHLPCPVDMKQVEAHFDGGMLRIYLPRCTISVRVKVSGTNA